MAATWSALELLSDRHCCNCSAGSRRDSMPSAATGVRERRGPSSHQRRKIPGAAARSPAAQPVRADRSYCGRHRCGNITFGFLLGKICAKNWSHGTWLRQQTSNQQLSAMSTSTRPRAANEHHVLPHLGILRKPAHAFPVVLHIDILAMLRSGAETSALQATMSGCTRAERPCPSATRLPT